MVSSSSSRPLLCGFLFALSTVAGVSAVPLNTTSSSAPVGGNSSSVNSTSHGVQKAALPVTVKENLQAMLALIDEDAAERFVPASENELTSFGSNDEVASNKALSEMVDNVFTDNPGVPGNEGWVEKYADFLVDAGQQDIPSLSKQFDIIDSYYDAVQDLQTAQKLLMAAYQNATGTNITNIGVKLNNAPTVDPLTIHQMEDWAVGYLGMNQTKRAEEKEEGEGNTGGKSKKDVFYTQANYTSYLKANSTVNQLTPEFQELDLSIQVSYQGYFLKEPIMTTYPAIYNLSMVIGGDPDSPQAQFAPAWSATIVNTTNISENDVDSIQDNLKEGLSNSTVSDTAFASSINDEAPQSTSLVSSPSSSLSSAKPTGSSSSRKRDGIYVPRRGAPIISSETSEPDEPACTPYHWNVDVHSSQGSQGSQGSEGSQNQTSHKASKPAKPASPALSVAAATTSKNDTATPDGSNSTSTDNPLDGVSNAALKGTMMLLSLQEGAWSNDRDKFINFARQYHPDVFGQYFGNGTTGNGPLGRHWTHVVLVTTFKPNSTDLQTIQLVGKVYNTLPVLRTNITLPSVSAANISDVTSKESKRFYSIE